MPKKPTPTPAHITLATPQQVEAVADLWDAQDFEAVPNEKKRGLKRLKSHPDFIVSRRQFDKFFREDKTVYHFGKQETRWYGRYFKNKTSLHNFITTLPNNSVLWISAYGQTFNTGSAKASEQGMLGWFTIQEPVYKSGGFSSAHMDKEEQRVFASVTPGNYAKGKAARYLLRWKTRA